MSRIRSLILLLSLSAVYGCGFHPVHAKTGGGLANDLASVNVNSVTSTSKTPKHSLPNDPGGREAQVLKYKLAELLSPGGGGSYAAYNLDIVLNIETTELGIQQNLQVTRYDIMETANYKLTSIATNQVVQEGTAHIKSSLNRTASDFSTFVAGEDASELAAEELAQELKMRLAAYFAK